MKHGLVQETRPALIPGKQCGVAGGVHMGGRRLAGQWRGDMGLGLEDSWVGQSGTVSEVHAGFFGKEEPV